MMFLKVESPSGTNSNVKNVMFHAGIFKQSQELCRMCLTDIYPSEDRSKILGNFNAISSLGFIVGPIIGGHFADLHSGYVLNALTTASVFILCGGK